ncbi:4'-phosphopantetheinyl transferase family protein [Flavobacterium algicola]|uniref:4'-phosphopantetheinyl transferase family protein n=1 Tax=Flavobacterium algicola TaxID=556529 RepID=UPI001EFE78DB|nr:4'-phosphopantetheinyl transferase superfamily protein [Flavobacterium algicola]MCG9791597.1 4'-phosphopantetheinyl transferase superfamily protein [Flavobacterium algicola]
MPLYKNFFFDSETQILVWKITETYQELFSGVVLNMKNRERLNGMKSELHQRGFLSVRKLLQEAGYNDLELYYDAFGKPHLKDDKNISITHSHEFSAIIISNRPVGIDVELHREKIIRIADKFTTAEVAYLNELDVKNYIQKLTVIWGAKEAIFKIQNEKGISFKEHISVLQFELDQLKTIANLNFGNLQKKFNIHFEAIENFTLVYAFEKR